MQPILHLNIEPGLKWLQSTQANNFQYFGHHFSESLLSLIIGSLPNDSTEHILLFSTKIFRVSNGLNMPLMKPEVEVPPCTLLYFSFHRPHWTIWNLQKPRQAMEVVGFFSQLSLLGFWPQFPSFQKKFFYNNNQSPSLILPGLIQKPWVLSYFIYCLSFRQFLMPLRFSFSIRKTGILKAALWMSLNPVNDLHKGSSTELGT